MRNIMTAPVITITPDTLVHEIAALLLERRISGVPVVANGEVVGMVNEGELLQSARDRHRGRHAGTLVCATASCTTAA